MLSLLQFLGRIALVAQRPTVVRLSRGRSVGLYVRTCVGLSSALWKNGRSDPDDVWHHRLDGSRDEAGSAVWGSVHGKGYFGANLGCAIVTNGDFTAYVALFPNYCGQSCYIYVIVLMVQLPWHNLYTFQRVIK